MRNKGRGTRDEGRGTRDEAALAPLLHHAGGTLTYAGTGWDIGYGAPDGPAFDIPRPAGAFSGAAALLRRDAFLRAGGFDPSFFAYCEDADLSWTFWQLGYRILYVPGAAVAHEYGASGGGRHSPFRVRHAQRNRLASMLKHVEGARLPQALLLSLAFDLFRLAAYGARGRWSLVAALLTGSAGALRDLPATWRDRRRLSRLRLVPNAELERLGVLASPAAAIREYLRLEFLRGPVKGRAWERAGEKP